MINPEAIDGGQPETQALRPLAKLNLLVHPGFKWSVHPTDYECFAGGEYIEAVRYMYQEPIGRLLPQAKDELLLIMPDKSRRISIAGLTSETTTLLPAWVDLYKSLKKRSPFPQNVRLVNNIVPIDSDLRKEVYDPEEVKQVVQRLKQLGFAIDQSTQVILGGQWTEQCVLVVANKLLGTNVTRELKIDRQTTLAYGSFSLRMRRLFDTEGFQRNLITNIKCNSVGPSQADAEYFHLSAPVR